MRFHKISFVGGLGCGGKSERDSWKGELSEEVESGKLKRVGFGLALRSLSKRASDVPTVQIEIRWYLLKMLAETGSMERAVILMWRYSLLQWRYSPNRPDTSTLAFGRTLSEGHSHPSGYEGSV
jgi:hypothetical protein